MNIQIKRVSLKVETKKKILHVETSIDGFFQYHEINAESAEKILCEKQEYKEFGGLYIEISEYNNTIRDHEKFEIDADLQNMFNNDQLSDEDVLYIVNELLYRDEKKKKQVDLFRSLGRLERHLKTV